MTDVVKTITVKVRVDPLEKRDLDWAAKRAGLPLSVWMRSLALQAARDQAAQVGRRKQ